VHPSIIDLYECGKLKSLFETKASSDADGYKELDTEERLLMRLLEAQKSAVTI
jgi:DNA topoisomerase IB